MTVDMGYRIEGRKRRLWTFSGGGWKYRGNELRGEAGNGTVGQHILETGQYICPPDSSMILCIYIIWDRWDR